MLLDPISWAMVMHATSDDSSVSSVICHGASVLISCHASVCHWFCILRWPCRGSGLAMSVFYCFYSQSPCFHIKKRSVRLISCCLSVSV